MDITLLLARLVMAAALGLAGASKVLDPRGLAKAAEDLRVGSSVARQVGRFLPAVELSLAALLVVGTTAWWAALSAGALFAAFTILVGMNLRAGNRPACHCFGELRATPIGPVTVVRNLGLVVLALFVLIAGFNDAGPGMLAWASDELGAPKVAALATLLAAALGALLVARSGREPSQPRRPAGLPIGVPAPEWIAPDLDGVDHSLTELRRAARGRPLLLLFVDPHCSSCGRLLPEVPAWEQAANLSVVVIGAGEMSDNAAKAAQAGLDSMLVARGSAVQDAYEYEGTPGAVVIDPDGRIGSHIASGAAAIRELVFRYLHTDAPVALPAPTPGEDAPPFGLPDLYGSQIGLGYFARRQTLVVFWDPMAPECQELLPALRVWEANRPPECQLVVVSRGGADLNRALGFHSAVCLDENQMTTRMYGATSAPAAVLVDAGLRIAGPTVHGASAVLELAEHAAKLSAAALRLGRPSVRVAAPTRKRRGEPEPTPGARRASSTRAKADATRKPR